MDKIVKRTKSERLVVNQNSTIRELSKWCDDIPRDARIEIQAVGKGADWEVNRIVAVYEVEVDVDEDLAQIMINSFGFAPGVFWENMTIAGQDIWKARARQIREYLEGQG